MHSGPLIITSGSFVAPRSTSWLTLRGHQRVPVKAGCTASHRGQLVQPSLRDRSRTLLNCGGELKVIAAILESVVIERILTPLGSQTRAPPRMLARERQVAQARRSDFYAA